MNRTSAFAGRLYGLALVAGLVAIGLVLATRPVGDEAARTQATKQTTAYVESASNWWAGQYLVTLDWTTGRQAFTSRFVLPQASVPWTGSDSLGNLGLLYDPHHPTTVALADASLSFNSDFRVAAAFESEVPFALALVALALLVIRPRRQAAAFTRDSIRRARASLRRYLLTPAAICALTLVAVVVIQGQPMLMYSPTIEPVASVYFWVVLSLLIWLWVRAVRFAGLRHLLTVVNDAADPVAVVTSVIGREVKVAVSPGVAQLPDDHSSTVRVRALRGQPKLFQSGQIVQIFGRWQNRGPALITNGETAVIGFGKRRVTSDHFASLERQYPALGRKLRAYLVTHLTLLVTFSGASIATVVRAHLNPGWLWLPGCVVYGWALTVIVHYSELRTLLSRPYVASHGVVLSIADGRRGHFTAIIEVPDEPTQKLRPIAARRWPEWLSEGQEVVVLQRPKEPGDTRLTAVLASPDGHAVLAAARTVQPES